MSKKTRRLVAFALVTCGITAIVVMSFAILRVRTPTEADPAPPAPSRSLGAPSTTTSPSPRQAGAQVALPVIVSDISRPTPTKSPSATPDSSQEHLRKPTETPAPILPPPPQGGSKLGVHGIWANRIIDFAQKAAQAGTPFRVVKAVDDVSWLKEIKGASPDTVTVARLTHEHEGAPGVNDADTDLDAYAALLMAPILEKLRADPDLMQTVDFWELTNEPLGGGAPVEAYIRLAQVTARSIAIAEANGLRLAILGLNAGTPEWADMAALAETGLFEKAKAGGHILALHEGVFGDDPIDLWWNTHSVDQEGNPTTLETGNAAPGGWIPGAPVLPGAGALCLRYRFLYHLLEARDEVVPLFISEFYAGGGYDSANKADVISRVQWYDTQLAKDDYVLGFAPFTLGPTAQWLHQDYELIYEGANGLVAYITTGRGSIP